MTDISLEELSTDDHGYTLNEEDEDDPVPLDRDGNPVETRRKGYPYKERMPRDARGGHLRPGEAMCISSMSLRPVLS